MQFVPRQQEVPIGGVPVIFPFKPYPSQKAMMAKVIQALNHGSNALLESPTGSGKSLALLCSSLAWQTQQRERDGQAAVTVCSCPCHSKIEPSANPSPIPCQNGIKTEPPAPSSLAPSQNGIKTEPPDPSSLAPSQNGIKTTEPPVSGSLAPSQNGTESGSSRPATSSSTSAPLVDGTEKGGGGGTEGERGTGGGGGGRTEGERGTGEGGGGRTEGERGTGRRKTQKVAAATNGEGDSNGVIEVDKDFHRPKKRYRTPGGAASGCKRLRVKGVVYIEEEGEEGVGVGEGGPWRMEVKSESLSATQQPTVMDTSVPSSLPPPTSSSLPPPSSSSSPCATCQCAKHQKKGSKGLSKIYFGTRTHQQISQITHELAKTAYTSTPMCILGSREHTCIHPEVSTARRKNDECRKLLDDGECSFYYRVAKKLGSQAQLLQHGMTTAWDMEDFVSLGKRVKACPYFALRGIKEEAHIIFCPYNYLIDPLIRDQMLIDLADQVVVLDEAHNMEDSAREAASLTVTSVQLEEVADELRDILNDYFGKLRPNFEFLQAISESIKRWVTATVADLPHDGFDQTCGIWSGQDFVPILKKLGIIDQTPAIIKQHITTIMDAVSEQRQQQDDEDGPREYVPCPSMSTVSVMKGLSMVLSYLLRPQQSDDYRISLMRTPTTKQKNDGWKRRRRSAAPERVWLYSLNFWCLNPAVAFSELSCARSVVLTSGTLSPLSSFSSELGMVFSVQLEANHVVPNSQTFIQSVSCGPHGRVLCANYQNSETYEFQDEVGAVVEQVCQTVPNGVLCFFSSYKMMNKLTQRWKVTGMWTSIEQKKVIIIEPHGSNKAEFETAMKLFYSTIETSSNGNHMTGALFLAVCRGKVSEGLDFADNNARAVVTIGIPFPSIKDKQVELKREYNNQYCRSRGLLSGSDWYEIQAFRAINQALGRCIRHREDWGALILVDERFSKGIRYTRGLSKWIRQRITHERNFSAAMRALTVFSERMTADTITTASVLDTTDTSTVLYSTCPTPLPSTPSSSTSSPHTSSTPIPKTRWLPPYCNKQHQPSSSLVKPSSVVKPSSLKMLISQLQTFKYPNNNSGPPPPLTSGPLPNEAITLNDSVEITCVENETILVMSSPSKPHPSSDPSSEVTNEVKREDDKTPPLSPRANSKKELVAVTKSITPLRRRKCNTRRASRRRGQCKASLIGCSDIDSTHSSASAATEVVRGTVTCSSCGGSVTKPGVIVRKIELQEALSSHLGGFKVHHIQWSRLWGHLSPSPGSHDVYLLSESNTTCRERGEGSCNAVWDAMLGLCYGLLECSCGHMVGVKVHAAHGPYDDMLNLINKTLLSIEKTRISDTVSQCI